LISRNFRGELEVEDMCIAPQFNSSDPFSSGSGLDLIVTVESLLYGITELAAELPVSSFLVYGACSEYLLISKLA
jgi:hypothetical protein